MKLQRIRYFVTLAETLSFSRTAEIHYVSQTTVSQQIRALENELGVDLFKRTKRKVELTSAGRAFLEDAQTILELVDRADEKMLMFRDVPDESLSLRIRATKGVTPGYIAPILNGFKDASPDIALSCSYCRVGEVYPSLVEREADVGLIFNVENTEHPDCEELELERFANYVVVSNRSHLAQHSRLTREQLVGERYVNTLESRGLIPFGREGSEAPAETAGSSGLPAGEAAPGRNAFAGGGRTAVGGASDEGRDGGEGSGEDGAGAAKGSAGASGASGTATATGSPARTAAASRSRSGTAERVGHDVGHSDVIVEDMDELLLAVSLGEGYSLLAEPMVQTFTPSLNLAAIPLDEEGVPFVAVRLKGNDNPAIDRFFDYVRP